MSPVDSPLDPPRIAHQARQHLNAISLSAGNLRVRLTPHLQDDLASALAAKLDKIERHVVLLAKLLDPATAAVD